MIAGHVVILSLISLIFILQTWTVAPLSVGFALFVYVLEILVAFIQAFIFTMLTALFIGMSRTRPTEKPAGRSRRRIASMEGLSANALGYLAAGLGAGLAVIGGGAGIGRLAASAMDGIARQPQSGGNIQTAMIIAAALIEGATLFALVICIILALK